MSKGRHAMRDHAVANAKDHIVSELREISDTAGMSDMVVTQHTRDTLMHNFRKLAPGRSASIWGSDEFRRPGG